MRIAVYEDSVYRRSGEAIYTDQAFLLFVGHLAGHVDRLVMVGRLHPTPATSHYRLPPAVRFVELPFYPELTDVAGVARALVGSLRRFWRVLDDVDATWLLGPHPLAVAFAALAMLRRKRVILGVRQELPRYARHRHPGRRWPSVSASALERGWHALARTTPVVAVGAELQRQYAASPTPMTLHVSLVRGDDLALGRAAAARSYDGAPLHVLSIGRLEAEKNPLLLADVFAELRRHDPRWRLIVCGDGPLRPRLAARLESLGLSDVADLRGYVRVDDGLLEICRASHVLLHVSWTEGVPQVLFEAFASGLPVVATAVGGVREALGDAGIAVPPGDAHAAAQAVLRIARDPELRERLVDAGLRRAEMHLMEGTLEQLGAFLHGSPRPPAPAHRDVSGRMPMQPAPPVR